ncbi:MAG: hypothetical protein F2923_06645 [Actinobacteria bacterium]|uniref:Unannotated protein n=1 Tax=freshwater metagenome TaxID=449393 RepID=A0A6J7GE87_9ZZZZ|nr:hypothetical protein [Actinomycetota bacterium]MTB28304.1 hypothetical protein [Actinomycetota bacterium]
MKSLRTIALISVGALALIGVTFNSAQATTCAVTKNQNGTINGVLCANGQPNEKAKSYLRAATPAMMKLTAKPSITKIKTAMCTDSTTSKATSPMLDNAVTYLAAQFKWAKSTVNQTDALLVNGSYCK